MHRILIADDDTEIAALISDSLRDEGFETEMVYTGNDAFRALKENKDYALVILDIMLPEMDGLTICRKIRDEISCPILLVTAKNRSIDTILGLEMGADDYIKKPFVVDELISRVKAHLRREQRKDLIPVTSLLKAGSITLYPERFETWLEDEKVELTPREFQLLAYLIENKGRVLSKSQIFDAVWGEHYGDINTVTVNIKNLRSKIDPQNNHIITVWGVGYKFLV
ncbi:response regulator transcription factor [Anoxybacterium hadale]|uniref:Response regulator transcription factor n=1 Tax=Anoxybacterium hadale TaxID=3408580 RepID=A0ACD1AHD9_9FIRM|nr:response regulator transcription factor [Clostridiales bacterium]